MTDQAPLRIIELRAENVKSIRAISIRPDGAVVEVAGKNGAGKSSCLDAIALALEGGAMKVAEPVRLGEERASVTLDLGEYVVTRTWNQGGDTTSLRVERADGTPIRKPQEILDGFVGRVAIDPLRFAAKKPRERREALLRLVPVACNLDELDANRQALFDRRTEVGREVRRLEGAIASVAAVDGPVEAEVSVGDLADQLRDASEANAALARARGIVERLRASESALIERVARLREELASAEGELITVRGERTHGEEVLASMRERPLDDIRSRIADAEATNRAVRDRNRAREERAQHEHAIAAARAEQDRLTAAIEHVDELKRVALAGAEFPVQGLGIGDEDVTFRDVPFSQLAASEQLKIGLQLAMAANPRLRVALLRDGSLLDAESRQRLAEWAQANDAQVWIETVGAGAEGAWVIEDGALAGVAAAVTP